MGELLDALGIAGGRKRALTAVLIWLAFPAAMLAVAFVQAAAEVRLGLGPGGCVMVLIIVWALWTWWHSVAFDRSRRHLLAKRDGVSAYRRGFVRQIFPGIVVGFSQMLRPAFNGADLGSGSLTPAFSTSGWAAVAVMAGVVSALAGTLLFLASWRTLGAARVGFVEEFLNPAGFVPERSGPYGRVRHPLFWSGVLISCALGLLTTTPAGLMIAAANVVYGLLYNRLEDRRLVRIYGDRYARYSIEVPHIIPHRTDAPTLDAGSR